MTMTKRAKIELDGRTAEVWWDTTDPGNPGWYVSYRDADGDAVDDSVKVWHPELPTDHTERALDEVREIARCYLAATVTRNEGRE